MIINKKELDNVLNKKNYVQFKQIFEKLPLSATLRVLNEKERLLYLIKKQDLHFIDDVFDFINNISEEEKHYNKERYFSIKSTANEFEIELNKGYDGISSIEIDEFKNQILRKVIWYKEKPDAVFLEKTITIAKKHNLLNEQFLDAIISVPLKGNFVELMEVIKKNEFLSNKQYAKKIISYSFQNTTDIDTLEYIIQNFSNEVRTVFFEKIEANDFWNDFKTITNDKFPHEKSSLSYVGQETITKLVWLEKNHLGYLRCGIPHFISFFDDFKSEDIKNLLEQLDSIGKSDQYLLMFSQAIQKYENHPELFNKVFRGYHTEIRTSEEKLLFMLNKTSYNANQETLYARLSKFVLKEKLNYELENKTAKKTYKI